MTPLTFKELKESFKNKEPVLYHKEYDLEEWKDGKGGDLILTDVCQMGSFNFIGYRCSNITCSRYSNKGISYTLFGHLQVIKEDGFHIHDKVIFTETKKRTLVDYVPNPVFTKKE